MENVMDLIQAAMLEYGRKLKKWYPSQDSNDPKERNLTFYLGNKLIEKKYTVFQEVPNSSGKIRIDMVATKGNTCIMVEAKRFYNLDEVKLINKDIQRINNVNLTCIAGFKKMTKIGIILAQTYEPLRKEFWEKRECVGKVRNKKWHVLKNNLPINENDRKIWEIYNYGTNEKLWALAAIFKK